VKRREVKQGERTLVFMCVGVNGQYAMRHALTNTVKHTGGQQKPGFVPISGHTGLAFVRENLKGAIRQHGHRQQTDIENTKKCVFVFSVHSCNLRTEVRGDFVEQGLAPGHAESKKEFSEEYYTSMKNPAETPHID